MITVYAFNGRTLYFTLRCTRTKSAKLVKNGLQNKKKRPGTTYHDARAKRRKTV